LKEKITIKDALLILIFQNILVGNTLLKFKACILVLPKLKLACILEFFCIQATDQDRFVLYQTIWNIVLLEYGATWSLSCILLNTGTLLLITYSSYVMAQRLSIGARNIFICSLRFRLKWDLKVLTGAFWKPDTEKDPRRCRCCNKTCSRHLRFTKVRHYNRIVTIQMFLWQMYWRWTVSSWRKRHRKHWSVA
jgi:hypothetical protein